ncbi:MAG: TonB-dependent receptor plug domain-containing protein [Nitrospiraceae bacterium]
MGKLIRFIDQCPSIRTGLPFVAIVTTCCLSFSELATAQSAPEDLDEIRLLQEETVETPMRREQPISKSPANVYVITDEDIRHSGAPDIPTVLRRVPGLEVMQVTGAQFNVSARGDNQAIANKMLVLVDGRSIYLDLSGETFWKALPVTLPEIKKIEVVKGPSSVLYGFNAFDGVINIITKAPSEIKGTTLQVGGGEFGTIASAAIHAGTVGKFGYRLSAGHDQNQQWRNSDALAFRSNKFNVQTDYRLPGNAKLFLEGGLVDVNKFDGNFTEIVQTSTAFSDGYARVGYERPNFFIRSFFRKFDSTSDVLTTPALAPFLRITSPLGNQRQSTAGETYDIDARHILEISSFNTFNYGANYRHNTISSDWADGTSHENRLGLYVENELRPMQSFSIITGVRYDLHSAINPTVSPRVALVYNLSPNHTLRGTAAVSYRSPTLLQEHFRGQSVASLPTVIPGFNVNTVTPIPGNTNLKPEQIISYDVGYQGWFLKHTLRIRADLFFNHISDLIGVSDALVSNRPGSADIYGGEAGFEYDATEWLSLFANYSYQEFGQNFTGDTRRGGPRFKINAGARGEWTNGLNGEIVLYHVGAATYPVAGTFSDFAAGFPPFIPPLIPLSAVPDSRVGSYNLLNIRGGYRFWKEKAEVAVAVFNALNDEHREHPLGDIISSRIMGWLTLKF